MNNADVSKLLQQFQPGQMAQAEHMRTMALRYMAQLSSGQLPIKVFRHIELDTVVAFANERLSRINIISVVQDKNQFALLYQEVAQ